MEYTFANLGIPHWSYLFVYRIESTRCATVRSSSLHSFVRPLWDQPQCVFRQLVSIIISREWSSQFWQNRFGSWSVSSAIVQGAAWAILEKAMHGLETDRSKMQDVRKNIKKQRKRKMTERSLQQCFAPRISYTQKVFTEFTCEEHL